MTATVSIFTPSSVRCKMRAERHLLEGVGGDLLGCDEGVSGVVEKYKSFYAPVVTLSCGETSVPNPLNSFVSGLRIKCITEDRADILKNCMVGDYTRLGGPQLSALLSLRKGVIIPVLLGSPETLAIAKKLMKESYTKNTFYIDDFVVNEVNSKSSVHSAIAC
jgi:hypothetical protein